MAEPEHPPIESESTHEADASLSPDETRKLFSEAPSGKPSKNKSDTSLQGEERGKKKDKERRVKSNTSVHSRKNKDKKPKHPVVDKESRVTTEAALSPEETRKLFSKGAQGRTKGDANTSEKSKNVVPPVMPLKPMDGVPPGLELLAKVTKLKVRLQSDYMPTIMRSFEQDTRYDIFNEKEQRIYFAAEKISGFGIEKPFEISICDFTGKVVLQLERPSCNKALCLMGCLFCCCCWRFGGKMASIQLGDGTDLGTVNRSCKCSSMPTYTVRDDEGGFIMQFQGVNGGDNTCTKLWSGKVNTEFEIIDAEDEAIGLVQKDFTKLEKKLERPLYSYEVVDDPTAFEATFKGVQTQDILFKARLLAAIFVLNNIYLKHEFPKYLN